MSDTPKAMKAVITVHVERYSIALDGFDGMMKISADSVNAVEMATAALTILNAVADSPNGEMLVQAMLQRFAKERRMRNMNNSGAN